MLLHKLKYLDDYMIRINKLTKATYEKDNQLELLLMQLNDWNFITVTGSDAKKYLQSQLTADINELSIEKHVFTAHCDAKGKMWTTLRLFHYKKGFGYILRTSVAKIQLSEMKKYSIFSKIRLIHQHNIILLGISGQSAREVLNKHFSELPDKEKSVIHLEKTTLLHFTVPSERFLIITDSVNAFKLTKYFRQHSDSKQWLALDIAAGFANIDIENSAKFIPQAVNLQSFPSSISFQKGCYIGQEIIARTKYRGLNNRSVFWLAGKANTLPKIGKPIEWKIGDNWRYTGIVLAAVKLTDNTITIQVVMKHDIPKDSVFRLLEERDSKLTIQEFFVC